MCTFDGGVKSADCKSTTCTSSDWYRNQTKDTPGTMQGNPGSSNKM